MEANFAVVVFSVLVVTLFAALVLPAPTRRGSVDSVVVAALLVAACLATVLTGAVALLDLPTPSVICGVIAWLLVVQCIWLARSPGAQDEGGWEEEEDDDGGGTPGPTWPSAPPEPDDGPPWQRAPERAPEQAPPAPTLPVPAPAHSFPLVAQAPPTALPAGVPSMAELVAEARSASALAASPDPPPEVQEAADPQPLRREPQRLRGDHPSIVHVRRASERAGRRRRANLHRRFLLRCRRLLWPEPPGSTVTPPSFAEPEHEGRRTRPPEREAGSRTLVL